MNLQRCAKCQKRPAMVFITRFENGKNINEGLCLVCANEMGIKPVNDIIEKMGLSEEDRKIFYGALAIFEANLRRISRDGIPERLSQRDKNKS